MRHHVSPTTRLSSSFVMCSSTVTTRSSRWPERKVSVSPSVPPLAAPPPSTVVPISVPLVLPRCRSAVTPAPFVAGLGLAPAYRLVSVHLAIRHGDRYHVHTLPKYRNAPVSCRFSARLLHRFPPLLTYLRTMRSAQWRRRLQQTFYDWPTHPSEALCGRGQLTPRGALQHVQNGQFLRAAYQRALQLNGSADVLVRSTKVSRTFQSAVALMSTLVPTLDLASLSLQQATNNSLCHADSGHSCYCPGIATYADRMANNMPVLDGDLQARERALDKQVAGLLRLDVSNVPWLCAVMDVSMIHACHADKLPGAGGRCMSVNTLKQVVDLVQENGRRQVHQADTRRVNVLKMQPLLSEIANRMRDQAAGKSALKFVLYSGHDTTLDAIATALNFSDGHWPRYASRIALELISRSGHSEKTFFIRVLYDGEVVTHKIHFCIGHMHDSDIGLCPLQRFQHHVKKGYLVDLQASNYKAACAKDIII